MYWLLEKDIFDENLEGLISEIENIGDKHIICSYIPFDGGLKTDYNFSIPKIKSSIYENEPIFAYGSLQFINYLKRSKLSVSYFCNSPQFECSYYYPRFHSYLFQKDYAFFPYSEINRKRDWILQHIGRQGLVFCRPNSGEKTFTGTLIDSYKWNSDYQFIGSYGVKPETMCVVAEPQALLAECRFIVGSDYDDDKQKVICGSYYKQYEVYTNEQIDKHHEAWRFVEHVLQNIKYKPDPFWVIDVAIPVCLNTEWKVLEVGSISCSGLYGCNLELFVKSISDYHKNEWKNNK